MKRPERVHCCRIYEEAVSGREGAYMGRKSASTGTTADANIRPRHLDPSIIDLKNTT